MSRGKRPSKEKLEKLYLEERKGVVELAKELKIGVYTLCDFLEEDGILMRTMSEAHLPPGVEKPSKEELKRLYEKMPTTKMAEHYEVSRVTVCSWMEGDGIQRRVEKPSKEELIRMYNAKSLSPAEIGRRYEVHHSTVSRWIRGYEISRKKRRANSGSFQAIEG